MRSFEVKFVCAHGTVDFRDSSTLHDKWSLFSSLGMNQDRITTKANVKFRDTDSSALLKMCEVKQEAEPVPHILG